MLEDKFEDQDAYTARQIDAKALMMTTPFIRSGFIEKKKLDTNPNDIFELLGLEKSLQTFKF